VRAKIAQEGIDAGKAMAKLEGAPAAPEGASAEDDGLPDLGRFARMLKMGVPPGAVRAKIAQEGIDADKAMAKLEGAPAAAATAGAASAVAAAPPPVAPPVPTLASLLDDPVLGRFAKMAKMRVPPPAVAGKMAQSGLSPQDQHPLLLALGLAKPAAPRGMVPPPRPPTAAERARAEGRRLRALHWETVNAVPKQMLQRSVFADVGTSAGEGPAPPSLDKDELEELASLFAVAAPGKGKGSARDKAAGGAKGAKGGAASASRLDAKRSNNVAIGLANFRRLPAPPHAAAARPRFPYQLGLLSALLRCDAAALPPGRLEPLTVLLPTPGELSALSSPPCDPASLPEADLFMWRCSLVPRIGAKARARLTLDQAPAVAESAAAGCRTLSDACDAVTTSASLRRLVAVVLAVGNAVNQGTARGGAVGFRLESLLKLRSTRAADGRTTLLDYVTSALLRQDADAADGVASTLGAAEKGRRVLLSELRSQGQQLAAAVAAAEAEAGREEEGVAAERGAAAADKENRGGGGEAAAADGAAGEEEAEAAPQAGADDGGMSALLASIRAKAGKKQRAPAPARGPGRAAGGAGALALTFPAEAPSLEDREAFVAAIRRGVRGAKAESDRLAAEVRSAGEASKRLAEFFAEDPASTTPDQVLSTLSSFATMYKSSLAMAKRRARAAVRA